MESPLQTLRRLLSSLESLLHDQVLLLQAGEHQQMLEAQTRSTPVFDEIIALSRQSEVSSKLTAADRERVRLLIMQQGDHLKQIDRHKNAARVALDSIATALSRTYELRTIYGGYRAPGRSSSIGNLA